MKSEPEMLGAFICE